MPFPASALQSDLALLLADIGQLARAVDTLAQSASARMAAGPVLATEVKDLDVKLRRYRARLVAAGQTPGIREYAAAQSAFAGLDVVAEWQAMIAAIDGVLAWIRTNFPTSSGFLLAESWGPDGPEARPFSSAQTAGLRTQLDALAATVS